MDCQKCGAPEYCCMCDAMPQTPEASSAVSGCEDDTETVVVPGKCDECGCVVDPDNIGFESDRFCICKKCDERVHELWEEFKLTDTYKHELEHGKQIEDLIDWN